MNGTEPSLSSFFKKYIKLFYLDLKRKMIKIMRESNINLLKVDLQDG
jgi:hypothetical protein